MQNIRDKNVYTRKHSMGSCVYVTVHPLKFSTLNLLSAASAGRFSCTLGFDLIVHYIKWLDVKTLDLALFKGT